MKKLWQGYVVIFLVCMVCFGAGRPIAAQRNAEGAVFLDAEIIVTQSTALVGASMQWTLLLTPLTEASLTDVIIEPLDTTLWASLVPQLTLDTLTERSFIPVSMIPLMTGVVHPALVVQFQANGVPQTIIVLSESAIEVVPVTSQIESWVTIQRGSLTPGQTFPAQLWIRNNTPFDLKLDIALDGPDLQLVPISDVELAPNKIKDQVLELTLSGRAPIPAFLLTIRWDDAGGREQVATLRVEGATIPVDPTEWERVSSSPWFSTILGIFVGALFSFAAGYLTRWQQRHQQQDSDLERMRGVLRLAADKADRAAMNGVEIDTTVLDMLLEDNGLHRALQRERLGDQFRSMVSAIDRYNQALQDEGGTQRAEAVRESTGKMLKQLEAKRG